VSEAFTQRVADMVRAEMARVRGMTQDKLAAAAGMSQSTLSRRLTGETAPDTDQLARIAAALGLRIELRLTPVTSTGGDPDAQRDDLGLMSVAAGDN
jgi:transcriptional regulator with XRE-family HTH domain